MKNKIHKLLGVALTAILLTTMTIGLVAVPASAGTLSWTTETIPGAAGSQVRATSLTDFVVASDGVTVYGVDGTALYKSANGGVSWTRTLPTGVTGYNLIAVAPDDPNIIAIGDAATPALFTSTNGGTSFSNLALDVTATGFANVFDVAIAPALGGIHQIAAAGDDGSSATRIQTFPLGAAVPTWRALDGIAGFDGATAARAVAFSPNYAGDRIMVIVTESTTVGVFFEIFSFASSLWNSAAGFADYTGTGHQIAVGTAIAPLQSASIDLLPTYLGIDEAERRGFVSLALNAGETTTPAVVGGIYRMTDEAETRISGAAMFHSVDYKTGDLLLAGGFGNNIVWRSSNPLAVTPTLAPTSLYQRPGGGGPTTVAWAGANAVASTSGVGSAFAISEDDGATFNDISLVNNALTFIEDIAVSDDGSKVYLLTNDATDISLWRKDSTWERVLYLAAPVTLPYNIVRLAPGNADVVYVADQLGTTILYSTDAGEKVWTLRACNQAITDLAVESESVLYSLAAAGTVSKSVNSGFIWATAVPATGLAGGATLVSLSEDNLIVGGTAGRVSYSTNGGSTWVPITVAMGAGSVQVTADGLATGDHIYAGTSLAGDNLYRWTIGTNTTAWTTMTAVGTVREMCTGIDLSADGVLYAITWDPDVSGDVAVTDDSGSTLYRALSPATATAAAFSTRTSVGDFSAAAAGGPRGLVISSGSAKLWAIDTDNPAATGSVTINLEAAPDAVGDEVYSFTEAIAAVGPAPTGPAAETIITVNPVTGRAYDISFTWSRPSVPVGTYDFQIALDSAFTQVVVNAPNLAIGGPTPALVVGPNTATGLAGAFVYMPDITYYWRVRVSAAGPVFSPYCATQSFTIAAAVEPPAPPAPVLEPELLAPTHGATGVSVFPTFAWSAIDGAIKYELEVAKDAAFAEKWISMSGRNALTTTAFIGEQQLDYATTYYWRVDCYADGEWGNWVTGIFTTEAAPVTPPADVHACPLCGLEYPTQQALADHYATYHAPAAPAAETPIYMWVIIGIGAVLVITMIILIVRTRRAV